MRIAIGLPTRGKDVNAASLVEWAVRADQGPFSTLGVSDRVVTNAQEPLIALAVAAGATRRIRLMTAVMLTPTHETTLLARQAASLDALSGGRFSMGVGVGVRKDDYEATGFDFHRRGALLDEQLAKLRRIWAGEPADPERGIGPIGPAPARPGGPEVLIGGYLPVVARRVAAWGDGFMSPGGGDPGKMAALWREIEAAWDAAGRAGRPRWVTGSYYSLGPRAEQNADAYIQANYGFSPDLVKRNRGNIPTTPQALRDQVRRRQDMGATEYLLRPVVEELAAVDELAEAIASIAEV
jgi:alkanesulfonate monooxygenase SsuD/methylene tetrahydromethanopterin reductase-like flavin-dependent oxidoreductase (luciferase family)